MILAIQSHAAANWSDPLRTGNPANGQRQDIVSPGSGFAEPHRARPHRARHLWGHVGESCALLTSSDASILPLCVDEWLLDRSNRGVSDGTTEQHEAARRRMRGRLQRRLRLAVERFRRNELHDTLLHNLALISQPIGQPAGSRGGDCCIQPAASSTCVHPSTTHQATAERFSGRCKSLQLLHCQVLPLFCLDHRRASQPQGLRFHAVVSAA